MKTGSNISDKMAKVVFKFVFDVKLMEEMFNVIKSIIIFVFLLINNLIKNFSSF